MLDAFEGVRIVVALIVEGIDVHAELEYRKICTVVEGPEKDSLPERMCAGRAGVERSLD